MRPMAINLFSYGTLMLPAVIGIVCDQTLQGVDASAENFMRVCLKDRIYPGMIQKEDCITDGILYSGISEEQLKRLDYFEGLEYQRQTITVELPNSKKLVAETYLVAPDNAHLAIERPWNVKEFKDRHLSEYLKGVRQTMRLYGSRF